MTIKRALALFTGFLCFMTVAFSSAQSLRFDPDPYFPVDQTFSVPLVLEAGGLAVKGVECIITYDPALVALNSITAGPWYTGSGQDFFFWDYTTGFTTDIHFASAMLDGTNSSDGIIAYCNFSFVGFGTCDLIFAESDIRDVNNDPLAFALDNGMIVLDQAVENAPVKFNVLKAIYR